MMYEIIKRLWFFLSCMCMAGLCLSCASTQQAQINVLKERVDELEGQAVHYQERINDLSNQIFVLTDRVDSTRVEMGRPIIPPDLEVVRLMPKEEIKTTKDQELPSLQKGNEGDDEKPLNIRMRGNKMPKLAEFNASDGSKRKSKTAKVELGAERVFRRALELFRQGKTESAYEGFAGFLSTYPNHEYSDNALYWMGDCRYEEEKYQDAITDFLKVVRFYPGSNKMPDVLFKVGLSYQRIGDTEKAQSVFSDLITSYPGSAFADLAKARMEGFKRVGVR